MRQTIAAAFACALVLCAPAHAQETQGVPLQPLDAGQQRAVDQLNEMLKATAYKDCYRAARDALGSERVMAMCLRRNLLPIGAADAATVECLTRDKACRKRWNDCWAYLDQKDPLRVASWAYCVMRAID